MLVMGRGEMMVKCEDCDKQQYKQRRDRPHEFLIVDGVERITKGQPWGVYGDTPYICTKCNTRFIYSTDENDKGWILISNE